MSAIHEIKKKPGRSRVVGCPQGYRVQALKCAFARSANSLV
jgi:hypothetical protein